MILTSQKTKTQLPKFKDKQPHKRIQHTDKHMVHVKKQRDELTEKMER